MAVARQRHDRSLVVAHTQLIGSLFDEKAKVNIQEFVQRGHLSIATGKLPPNAEVDAKVAEIEANNGKLIVEAA